MTPDHISFDEKLHFFDLKKSSLSDIFFIANRKQTPIEFIKRKRHVIYFNEYLKSRGGLNATYAVLEDYYISKDYLSDFSSYYAACFDNYKKYCSRIHFFESDKDESQFIEELKSSIIFGTKRNQHSKKLYEEGYLGYIVVKPIPYFFIGFTLLKNYNTQKKYEFLPNHTSHSNSPVRIFWGTKDYKVHLFGNEIIIRSLAFQEQDRNVAACATIAIWSMLQRAAEDYYVILQSPGEITNGSDVVSYDGNRLLPNKGLSLLQIAKAIVSNNMISETRSVHTYNGTDSFNLYLKKLINAYSPLHIPMILAIDMDGKGEGHVVAVCGHNLLAKEENERKLSLLKRLSRNYSKNLEWKAERIEKLYCHDDQWGPFARMYFKGKNKIESAWNYVEKITKNSTTVGIIIPLYPKIRIAFEDIENKVVGLNKIIVDNFTSDILNGPIIWDIQLILSEEFKSKFQQNDIFDDSEVIDRLIQLKLLTRNFPKYIWVVTLLINEQTVLQLLYDATGLQGSNLLLTVIGYFSEFNSEFNRILEENKNRELFAEVFEFEVEDFMKKLNEFDSRSF